MKDEKIWLSSPHMGGDEQKFVNEAFSTNWIAPLGPNVNGFEKDIQDYLGIEHAAALSSGTAALHLALILLGVEKDDVVLCQSLTFSASANPIAYQGARPIFIDSEEETWNMDPEKLREVCEQQKSKGEIPKAIVVVHLYGMPAKMDEIRSIASEYQFPIVEDAAEALGSTYKGQPCGTLGDLSILSFNGNKIITTSGGGALVGRNRDIIEKARFLATQARDPAPHYQHSHIGYNYRMSNICAGIGRGQMKVLKERVKRRRFIHSYYENELNSLPGVTFLTEPEGFVSNRWLTTIIVNPEHSGGVTREDIRLSLEERNIESRPLWKPMHLQPAFAEAGYGGGDVAARLFEMGLCLPSGSNLDEADLKKITSIFKEQF